MEYGTIEREIFVEASPEVVFEVISRPEHLREWWPDDATLDPAPGGTGELVWNGDDPASRMMVPLTVVEVVPPRLFSFRWAYDPSVAPDSSNSFLATFELVPADAGTTVRFTETGFRGQDWTADEIKVAYREHGESWDRFIPRLATYAAGLTPAS